MAKLFEVYNRLLSQAAQTADNEMILGEVILGGVDVCKQLKK